MQQSDPPIIVEATFPVAVNKVWDALTVHSEMSQWYFPNIPAFEATVGFKTQFAVQNEGRTFTHLWEITEVVPLQKLKYNWKYEEYKGDSYVTFLLNKTPEGTHLQLVTAIIKSFPRDIPEFKYERCQAGWKYFIQENLKSYLDKE